jgi:hypothetical protein
MEADPSADDPIIRPAVRGHPPLHGYRRAQRLSRIGEGGEEFIGSRVDLVAARPLGFRPQQAAHLGQESRISVAELGQVPRRVLDVGQQQGDTAGRQPKLGAELAVDEPDRHDPVALGGLEEPRPRSIPRALVVEHDPVEASQRVADVGLVVDREKPPSVRTDVGERAVGQPGPRLRS